MASSRSQTDYNHHFKVTAKVELTLIGPSHKVVIIERVAPSDIQLVVTADQSKLLTLIGFRMNLLGAGDENRTRVLSLGSLRTID